MNDVIYSINGPVITVRNTASFSMRETVYVGEKGLLGEVIRISDRETTIQVYETTAGLKPGEAVRGSGSFLHATLGPGMLGNIYDGIERPLEKMHERQGAFLMEGHSVSALDETISRDIHMLIAKGERVTGGQVFASCMETAAILHKAMIPNGVKGTVVSVVRDGRYTVKDVLAVIKDEETGKETEVTLQQKWPVRIPRPIAHREPLSIPLITGQLSLIHISEPTRH